MQDQHWEILATTPVLSHPFLTVTMTQVRLPDGRIIDDWPIVHMRDYIAVFAVDQQRRALVLEGYKHGLGRSSWQVVAGYVETNEKPLETAKRELREETGYESDQWEHLGSFVVDLNRHGGTGHIYLARNVSRTQEPTDDDLERVTLKWASLAEIEDALRDGRVAGMSHAVTISLALTALKARET